MTCFPARPLLWLVISPTRRSPKKHKLNALANIVDSYTDVQTKRSDWKHSHSTTLIICSQTDNSICPVHLLKGYLEVQQHALDSNLYLHFDGSDLTRYQFSIISIGRPTPPFFYYVVMNTKTFSLCCGPYSERMWSKMSFDFTKWQGPGLLRVGEITSQSKGRAGKHVIHISDIKLVRKQDSVDLHLMIRSSKTDQHSHSTHCWKNVVENVLWPHKMTRPFVRRLKIDIALDLIRQSANKD
jgi:hypothetical protein